MKKILTICLPTFVFYITGNAQITLDSINMPYVGFSIEFAKDTPVTSVNYGSAGTNQSYNFSSLTTTSTNTSTYTTPTTAQHTHFPLANMMASADGLNFIAVRLTGTYYDAEGLESNLAGNNAFTPSVPADTVSHIPVQYLNHFTGSYASSQTVPASWVGQGFPVDSVRLTYTDKYWDTIDGWGTIATPLGTYNCLREARRDSTHTLVEADILGSWSTVENSYSNAVTYQYLAKETRGAVVKFDYDTGVNASHVKDAQYALIPPSPIAHFTFATGTAGLVTFTDNSSNSPGSYHWNFGDGDTSDVKSPMHTYAYNGTYYVCETVANVSGDSTYCDSVHITNIPGPTAHFTWATGGGGLINFTNQNTGNPTTYHWTFGDGDTSNVPTPSHTYAANGAYYVCETVSNLNGSNTYCDSVHVTGISAGHQAPVAVQDTASVTKPNSINVNVTANDYSPSGDTFCITSVSNTTYFTVSGCNDVIFNSTNAPAPGVDSTWYVICNIHQSNLCDSALLIVTVNKQHLAPVAATVYDTTLQPSPVTIDITSHDSSPSNDAFCVTAVYPATFFTVLNCNNVKYTPDSTFTGNDTAYYVICNTGQPTLCDTAIVIVTDNPNSALLPAANFTVHPNICNGAFFYNASTNYGGNPTWHQHDLTSSSVPDSTEIIDTAYFNPENYADIFQICLTVTNQYGSSTKCDSLRYICDGINSIALSNIKMFPNPANNYLSIDMLNNTDEISTGYTAIEIYNSIGQKAMELPRGTGSKLVNVPVSNLPEGLYLATITDSKGARRTLGQFTVVR